MQPLARSSTSQLIRSLSIAKLRQPLNLFSSCFKMASTFPIVPRCEGIASVTHRASSTPGSETATVHFVTVSELQALFSSPLEASDVGKESTLLKYVGGEEEGSPRHRVLYASTGKSTSEDGLRKATLASVARLRALKVTSVEFVLPECSVSGKHG